MQESSIVSIVFLSVFLGFTPVIFYAWLFFLRRKEKFKQSKQPTGLMITMFFGGVAAVIVSFFAERYLIEFLPPEFAQCVANSPLCQTTSGFTILILAVATFLIVGPIEEGFKSLAIFGISFRSPKFTRIIDGAKFGVAVALGFASAENALYLFSSLRVLDLDTFVSTFLLRFALSSPAHLFYSGLFGYYLGRANFVRYGRAKLIITGLFLAIVTHGLYDFVLFSQVGFYVIFVLVALFGALYLIFKRPENFAIRIPEFMRRSAKSRQKIYQIPIESDLTPITSDYQRMAQDIPEALRPVGAKLKPEYIPKEVPSEFAQPKPQEPIKKELTVPEATVKARKQLTGGGVAQQVRIRKALTASQAQSVVDSSVRDVKRKRLEILPPPPPSAQKA